MGKIDQIILQILDLELLLNIREANARDKFDMLRCQPFSTIRRLSEMYWSMDITDLLDLERSAWNTYLALIDITELTDLIHR